MRKSSFFNPLFSFFFSIFKGNIFLWIIYLFDYHLFV